MLDIRVLELLSARLCHDLISPVSAIANGIELVTEFEDEMQGEALSLIGDSAKNASGLLQFYRAAFGSARSAEGGMLGLAEARQRTISCLGAGRIKIDWPTDNISSLPQISRQGLKLLMNLALAAGDVLPGDGVIRVSLEEASGAIRVEVTAAKDGLALNDQFREAFAGSAAPDDLTPKNIVAYLCWLLAEEMNSPLEVTDGTMGVSLSCLLPLA